MKETAAGIQTKDKDIKDVQTLLGIKAKVEVVSTENDSKMLQLDQLEESLRLLNSHGAVKEAQIRASKKLFDEWTNVKKLAKEIKKEIEPIVSQETQKNTTAIEKLFDELKAFSAQMKKREFYQYKCGREPALEKIEEVNSEINKFNADIEKKEMEERDLMY